MPSARKIRRVAGVVLGGTVVLLALVAVLLPRVVKLDAVRTAIERAVSKELGGTAALGRLDLSFIPRTQIEIRDLKIEVPGAVSASLPVVDVSARLLPLLRGRIAVESVTLDRPAIVLSAPAADPGGTKPPSAWKQSVAKALAVAGRAVPDLALAVKGGSISLVREGRESLSLEDVEASLAFVPVGRGEEGGPGGQPEAAFHLAGAVRAVIGRRAPLPGPVTLSIAQLDADPGKLAVAGGRVRILDMDLTFDGSVAGYLSAAPASDIRGGGSVGADAAAWVGSLAGLPAGLKLRSPLTLSDARLRISGARPALTRELTGSVSPQGGPAIPLALRLEPGMVSLTKLEVKDGRSDARMAASFGERGVDFAFDGSLEGSTLQRVFELERVPFGAIAGDLRVRAPRGRWKESTAEGTLEGTSVAFPVGTAGTLAVDRFSVRARGRALALSAAAITLAGRAADGVALTLSAEDGRPTAVLERGSVCGIALAGTLRLDGREVEIALQPRVRGRNLEEDLACLLKMELAPTGTYDLSGSFTARGSPQALLQSVQGSFDLSAKKGKLRNARLVEGVLAYLEKTSALDPKAAARMREGVPYDAIAARGTLQDGVLDLTKASIKSKVLQVAADGKVDLRGRSLDLQVLVAPLSGVDRVLNAVPVVRHLTGDALVVVPVRVVGPFEKPEVKHLPASGVGTSVGNLMKNIVQAPVKIVEPLAPSGGGPRPE